MRKLFIFIALLSVTASCRRNNEKATLNISGQEVLDSAVINQSKGGRKLWQLRASRIEVVDSVTKVYGFEVKFYGAGDSVVSVLKADSGVVYEPSGHMTAMGDVVVVTADSTVLTTKTLSWDSKSEKIYTESEVTIVDSSGRRLEGRGLEADPQLTHVRIKSEVKGYGNP